ncbi:MAG: hypothetical protein CENE_00497 [Candidatus Celerinatantimonas neptuna]|nr:MAG: hypothetical protein CENE_00497 [Candidatus Celerinatantimonas neptuna]
MSTLYQSLTIILPLICAFSFLLMMLVLIKGELCHGQRSRLSQQFVTLWSFASLALVSAISSKTLPLIATITLSLTIITGWWLSYRQFQLKIKHSVKCSAWWYPGIPLLITAVILTIRHPYTLLASCLASVVITHWLMVKAEHQLKTFNRLLPFIGIILFALLVGLHTLQIWLYGSGPLPNHLTHTFIYMIAFALTGLFMWLLPLLRNMDPIAGQLAAASLCFVIVAIKVTELQFLLHH